MVATVSAAAIVVAARSDSVAAFTEGICDMSASTESARTISVMLLIVGSTISPVLIRLTICIAMSLGNLLTNIRAISSELSLTLAFNASSFLKRRQKLTGVSLGPGHASRNSSWNRILLHGSPNCMMNRRFISSQVVPSGMLSSSHSTSNALRQPIIKRRQCVSSDIPFRSSFLLKRERKSSAS